MESKNRLKTLNVKVDQAYFDKVKRASHERYDTVSAFLIKAIDNELKRG